jgi:hypothetical protein
MSEQVTLVIHRPLILNAVDDKDVDTFGLGEWNPPGSVTISVPAGKHDLYIRYESIVIDDKYRHEISGSTIVTYDFDPGFQYSLSPYTEVFGVKTKDVNTAVILELDKGLKIDIEKKPKAAGGAFIALENGGALLGVSMGPVVRLGVDMGLLPIGFTVDTGKVSYSFDTNVNMGVGWRPLNKEILLNDGYEPGETPGGMDIPIGFDFSLSAGGLFGMYLNRENGKAFGLGFGGGYTTSLFHIIDVASDPPYSNYPNVGNMPIGIWYVRGAVIPNRKTRFTIYFDYYLKNLVNETPALKDFFDPHFNWADKGDYYSYVIRHPRSWYGWGLGISGKLF